MGFSLISKKLGGLADIVTKRYTNHFCQTWLNVLGWMWSIFVIICMVAHQAGGRGACMELLKGVCTQEAEIKLVGNSAKQKYAYYQYNNSQEQGHLECGKVFQVFIWVMWDCSRQSTREFTQVYKHAQRVQGDDQTVLFRL